MAIQRFEYIIAWQKAQDMAVYIYAIFGSSRDFVKITKGQKSKVLILPLCLTPYALRLIPYTLCLEK